MCNSAHICSCDNGVTEQVLFLNASVSPISPRYSYSEGNYWKSCLLFYVQSFINSIHIVYQGFRKGLLLNMFTSVHGYVYKCLRVCMYLHNCHGQVLNIQIHICIIIRTVLYTLQRITLECEQNNSVGGAITLVLQIPFSVHRMCYRTKFRYFDTCFMHLGIVDTVLCTPHVLQDQKFRLTPLF